MAHATDEQLARTSARTAGPGPAACPRWPASLPGFRPQRAPTPTPSATCSSPPSSGILADLSQVQPVVLVLDDLQWADRGSLLLLRHLAAAEQISRLLILATYRDSELRHADALRDTLGALRRQSGVQRIELSGLNDHEVVSYFEAASGQTLDARRPGPGPCGLPRDRWQSLLRRRGAPPPGRERRHPP